MTTQDLVEFKANLKALFPNCFNRNGELDFESLKRVLIEAQVFAKVQEMRESKSDSSDSSKDLRDSQDSSDLNADSRTNAESKHDSSDSSADSKLESKDSHDSSDSTKDLLNAFNEFIKSSHYKFDFIGKNFAKTLYNLPPKGYIMPLKKADSNNAIIIGDNLSVLKHLKNAYRGAIKAIYIDPPYNTQGDGFIYNDSKRFTKENLSEALNISPESANAILERTPKGKSNHSAWLCFMYPRLALAKDLLRDDGVIFISIDDNEQANLKLLCDEVFGEGNFVACAIWNSINSVLKQSKFIRKEHEYILIYAKNKDSLSFSKLANTMEFENPDNDPKGEWFSSNAASPNQDSDKNKFAIKLPNGEECVRNWKFSFEEFQNGEVSLYFKDGNVPRLKIYKSEYNVFTKVSSSIFKDLGSLTSAKAEIKKLFGIKDDIFDTPKPTELIKRILEISTSNHAANERERERERNLARKLDSSGDIILDFFAGSGTTAQAVMELNAEDGGNRKFILVQLNENIDEKKSKVAFDFCKNELKSNVPMISDITIERVKRAGEKVRERNDKVDTSFKVYALQESLSKDYESSGLLQGSVSVEARDIKALLESYRLRDGLNLNAISENINLQGYNAYKVGDYLYLLESNFKTAHLAYLLKEIAENKDFNIRHIVYFSLAFESKMIRELHEGVESFNKKKPKGITLNVYGRTKNGI